MGLNEAKKGRTGLTLRCDIESIEVRSVGGPQAIYFLIRTRISPIVRALLVAHLVVHD